MPASSTLAEPPRGNGPWALEVEAVGSPRDGQQTATLGTRPGASSAFRVAATLPRYPQVLPGDRVSISGAIRARPDSPYGEYLRRIGAVGTVTARSLTVEPAPADIGRRLEDLRRAAAEALAVALPEPEAGLAAGILIGLRDRVDRELAAAFTTAGVSHVVAISGWNIAIVAAAVAAVAGGLGRRRRSVVTIVAIVAVRPVRRCLAIGRSSGANGGRRPGRSRERARRTCPSSARLGRGAAPRGRSRFDPRRRLSALVAGDGGTDRLGDAAHRMVRVDGPRTAAPLAR